jgi:hypothetical protein
VPEVSKRGMGWTGATEALETTRAGARSWRCRIDHQPEAAASAAAHGGASLERLKVIS